MARDHEPDNAPAGEAHADRDRPRARATGAVYVADGSLLGSWIRQRQELGQDEHDEVWEGIYHVNAQASFDHDEFVLALGEAIRRVARRHKLGRVGNTNIREPGTEDRNFRVPDLMFVKEGGVTRFAERSRVWIEHGPDLVIEVRSQEDPRAKLGFYAARGIPEVVVFDSCEDPRPDALRLSGSTYLAAAPDPEGGLALECLGARLFYTPAARDAPPRLALKDDRTGEVIDIAP